MTDTTPAPRCPSCGAAMTIALYTKQPDGSYLLTEEIENATGYCLNCKTYHPTTDDARVPCPACNGDGEQPATVDVSGLDCIRIIKPKMTFMVNCDLCRGRGNVSSALAAAWTADAPQSSGGEE